ncbi:MAG: phage portal protein [Pseudomonadota bacterium]
MQLSAVISDALDRLAPSRVAARERAALEAEALRQMREELAHDAARRQASDGWVPITAGPNALGRYDGPRSRAAAHDAARNNPLARRALDILPAYVIGKGFRPMLSDVENADRYLDWWRRFVDTCCIDDLWDFHHYARLAVTAMVEGGFSFVEYANEPDAARPVSATVLEAEFLDESKTSSIGAAANARLILNGIEFDARGRRVAHWLHASHPGEGVFSLQGYASRPLSRDRCDMVFMPRRPGEIIPVTWLAGAIQTLRDRKDGLDSERMRAKVQSLLAMIVRGAAPGSLGQVENAQDDNQLQSLDPRVTDGHGRRVERLTPGSIVYAGHGASVDMLEPKGQALQPMVLRTADHDVAASLSIPYFLLTGDYEKANFSTSRMALLAFQQQLDVWQPAIARLVYRRAWQRAMAAGQRLGQVPAGPVPMPDWVAPRLYTADPVKDTQAKALRLAEGLDSEIAILEAEGRDPGDVVRERRRYRDLLEESGLAASAPEIGAARPGAGAAADDDEGGDDEGGDPGEGDAAADASALSINDVGIAFRSGLLTAEQPLEQSVRAALGLPEMGEAAQAAWAAEPVRSPVTLARAAEPAPAGSGEASDAPAPE